MTDPRPLTIEPGAGEHAGIATILLEQEGRPVVVLDHDLIRRLEATIRALPAETRGLVLASAAERAFVAGADLKAIMSMDDAELHRYLEYGARVFGMLARLPFPTCAAINGAALGGGLELAMHCDGLVAAPLPGGRPYPVGLPEAGLGICPGWGGTQMLPARIDPAAAVRMTASGTPMKVDEAIAAHLFDAVTDDSTELRRTALDWVRGMITPASIDRDGAPNRCISRPAHAPGLLEVLDGLRSDLPATRAATAVAECVEIGLHSGWEAGIAAERERLVALRHTPEATAAIEAFFAKTGR